MAPGIKSKLLKSWAPIFYEHVFCQIDEKPFAVLYGETGNSNFPVNILLSLEYIKHMRDCPDSELLDDYYFDYLVNYAIGNRTLGERNLAERTLYYFRARVYQYLVENPEKEDFLFGQFIELTKRFASKAGVVMGEQRMDSTMFMSNMKKAGRLTLAYDVLCNVVSLIPEKKLTETLANVLKPSFKTDTLYRAKSQDGDSKLEMLLNLCHEAVRILEGIKGSDNSDAFVIAKRFLAEQADIDETTQKCKAKDNKNISSTSLQSAYDADATYRKKGKTGHVGYVLNLAETCHEDNPFQLITDYVVEKNVTSDVEMMIDRLPEICENTGCEEMFVDGGYHSPKVVEEAAKQGVKLHFTNLNGREPSKKLPVTAFEMNEETNIITKCPKGNIPLSTGVTGGQTVAHFSHGACSNCEFYNQCHSKQQKKDCVVRISLNAIRIAKERLSVKSDIKENTSKRAAIEGTNSALKRGQGQDKLGVRGQVKCAVVSGLKVMAQNIKRFTKYWVGGYKQKLKATPPQGIPMPIPA
ncbi:MAG: transposase [Hyphomonadaceae bacterium]|nr:transposase [Clostridia bacterium]